MENALKTDSPKKKNAVRQMWSHEEDKALLEIVRSQGKMVWGQVADKLKEKLPHSNKTGKQCRERYRNYVDPGLYKKEWSKSDKIIFLLLHKQYGNHWGQIAKYFQGRNDISLKNLFYSYIRRVLRHLKEGNIQVSLLSKPQKVLQYYYVIDVIQHRYLPILAGEDKVKTFEEKHEKILLTLIKEKSVTEAEIIKYKQQLLNGFKEENKSAKLPIQLVVNSSGLNLSDSRGVVIQSLIKSQSFGDISKYIVIKFTEEDNINLKLPINNIPAIPAYEIPPITGINPTASSPTPHFTGFSPHYLPSAFPYESNNTSVFNTNLPNFHTENPNLPRMPFTPITSQQISTAANNNIRQPFINLASPTTTNQRPAFSLDHPRTPLITQVALMPSFQPSYSLNIRQPFTLMQDFSSISSNYQNLAPRITPPIRPFPQTAYQENSMAMPIVPSFNLPTPSNFGMRMLPSQSMPLYPYSPSFSQNDYQKKGEEPEIKEPNRKERR